MPATGVYSHGDIKANNIQPTATGQDWEKYRKTYSDEELEEKKITPLTDECVLFPLHRMCVWCGQAISNKPPT